MTLQRLDRWRLAGAFAAVVVLLTLFPIGMASAEPVYEITGRWVNPPAAIARGNPVVAEWRFNVNDDQPAPSNDPVDNVTAVFTIGKAVYDGIPDTCLTTGVSPPSSISADGLTLTCNFGTVDMGTAMVLQVPVIADGITGDQLTMSGTSPSGQTIPLPPIAIRNPFSMDIYYGQNTAFEAWNPTFTAVDTDIQFTLRLGNGSDAGPNSVSYTLRVTAQDGSPVNVGDHPRQAGVQGCTNFDIGIAEGHPWSRTDIPATDPRNANPVSCTLTETATPGTFTLTLTGINYSLSDIPTEDSASNPLPLNWDAVASGTLWFRVITDTGGSITLDSNEPTYTSATGGLTYRDLPGNNVTTKTYTLPGTFSAAWHRAYTRSGGTSWDDSYKVSAGTTLRQFVNNGMAADDVAGTAQYGNCLAFDYRYVRLDPDPSPFAPVELVAIDNVEGTNHVMTTGTIWYYTGNNALLNPSSPLYEPNNFSCNLDPGGWSTTPPADLSTVKAVRATYPHSLFAAEDATHIQMRAHTQVLPSTPGGTDVWMFGSVERNGDWTVGIGEPWESNTITPTPGARYPWTNGRRDIVRIVTAVPFIQKAAARSTVVPGEPADFTLTYSANGSGLIPPSVDDFTITDTLPIGMTYEPGSADPEPTVTMSAGHQVLTWNLDGVTTNEAHTLTYQAVASSTVEPGEQLTNTAVASFDGEDSEPAEETVTTTTNGYTQIGKAADQVYIPNPTEDGVGSGSWTVSLRSFDPTPQTFTDTIDILPYNGDQRGTDFNGTYELDSITGPGGAALPAGTQVYYTTAPVATLSDDPADVSNGSAGSIIGNTVSWAPTKPASGVTAVRVIGPTLAPGTTFQFQVHITTDGAEGGDVYVNRAQSRASHTQLVMRTSDFTTMATFYSAELKKYVQDRDGTWHDAQDVTDYPTYEVGEEVPYRIVITNTGRGTLTNFTITDDKFSGGSFTVAELAPQASETHEFKITLTEANLGRVVNTACATVDMPEDAVPPPEIPCDPAGIDVARTTFNKELIGTAEPNGDGTYTVTYAITVKREGMPGIYRLTDTLKYGAGTTIQSTAVANTDPGTVETNTDWDGTTDTEVAADVAIDVDDTHEYRATVITAVDPAVANGDSSDCNLAGSESGTGFLNQAHLEIDDKEFDDDVCPPFPVIRHTKELVGDPVRNRDGTYTLTYEIVVSNIGAAAGTYDLEDELVYGAGITVRSASIANTAPGGISTSGAWNGTTSLLVVSDQSLDPGASHTYTVTVNASVPGGLSSAARDCDLTGGESGTGFRNESTLTTNGTQQHDDACGSPADSGGRLARTGSSGVQVQVLTALVLVAIGTFLSRRGHRRRLRAATATLR